ncbi:uncharacterized protein N7479_000790 [Penicillium vulpinum]|uniref:Oxidoreductase n=1 Tax=Penicillium vulpinum TaxID=29845 RepID=A0A1V6S753_9EURO|nr:uncharacterized protein N7479_000790 [Penicillium vulpinum]KAJ5970872.1 hypothetical protein N7479_000790 [Penicillium vulpinum]OQE09554.1 hypothetical protein PENVUL_c006G03396 [Penicillium vulpinum]
MAFPYKHFLVVGATAGIGKALAARLVESGAKVTVVGRRQERLDEFVQTVGAEHAKGERFDIGELAQIPDFVERVMKESPDIDSIVLNAGVQNTYDLADLDKFNLPAFLEEVKINFSSFVSLTHAFLPYLQKNPDPTSFIFTGSNLAIVPAASLPAYSASKAALNVFTLCLREQLRHSNTKVIEISPPPVQTELHDYMGEEAGRQLGMPLDTFTEQVYQGLAEGSDQIVIGSIGPADTFNGIVNNRRSAFENLSKIMRGGKP